MKINWDRWVRRDRGTLLFTAFAWFLSAGAFLYLDFSKPTIKSKSDLTFISGSFVNYSWISYTRGSSLIFKLENYTNKFKIKADFFPLLKTEEFKSIPYGKNINISIPKGFEKYLNTNKDPFFVYSISSDQETYLDFNDTIKKHNSPLFSIVSSIFILLGSIFIYLGCRAKVKTSIF